jgi:hypothetical protein
MAGIDDIYAWFAEIHDYLRPTEAELYHQQREAERQHCGYSMITGKPGTFRANARVPRGEIIIFDEEALEELWKKQTSSSLFADGELSTERIMGPILAVRHSFAARDISNGFNP